MEDPLQVEGEEEGERDDPRSDEDPGEELAPERPHRQQHAGGTGEGDRALLGGQQRRVLVLGAATHGVVEPGGDHGHGQDGDDENHEGRPPAEQRRHQPRDHGAYARGQALGVGVQGEHTRSVGRAVVITEQRPVNRIVDDQPEAVAEADEHHQADGRRQAGGEREDAGQHRAGHDQLGAGEVVGVEADGQGRHQHDRQVEDDEQGEGLVREVEGGLDLRRQGGEGGGVELVEEIEEEQDHQAEDGHAAGDSEESMAGPPHAGGAVEQRGGVGHVLLPLAVSTRSSDEPWPSVAAAGTVSSTSGGGRSRSFSSTARLSATMLGTMSLRRSATQRR